ncbi:MAG: hypothetical protein ACKPAH_11885 [Verrucomicrobiota bacterium]
MSPEGGALRLGVRVQGQMSQFLAETVRVGDTLDVMTPSGRFHPQDRAGAHGRYFPVRAARKFGRNFSVRSLLQEGRFACRTRR